MVGRVVSAKMNKSAVVLVESKKTHPKYRKSYAWSKKYIVDDPYAVKAGDVVVIEKVRPISKMKHWQIKKVLGQDIVSMETAGLIANAQEAIAKVLPEVKQVEQSVVKEAVEAVAEEAPKKKKAIAKAVRPSKVANKKETK